MELNWGIEIICIHLLELPLQVRVLATLTELRDAIGLGMGVFKL